MGGSQSRAAWKKGPTGTTVALPSPPSPFLAHEQHEQHGQDGHGVLSRLIGALSAASLGAPAHLPPSLLLLRALVSGSASEDLRLLFSEQAFAVAFPDFADMRLDLLALGDMVQVSRQHPDSVDVDYYLAARVSCLANPHGLFSGLMTACVQGAVVETREELQVRRDVVHDLTTLLLKRVVGALHAEHPPADLPGAPFIRGICSKFDFVLASLSVLLECTDLDKFLPDHHPAFNDKDFEDSLFTLLVSYSCFLYRRKQFVDALNAATAGLELYSNRSLAVLPQARLQFIQCKALIWLGSVQAATDLAGCIESSIAEFVDLMNDPPPAAGLVSKYEASRQHLYYLLMTTASDAGCSRLCVSFGRSALLTSPDRSELGVVIAMTVFVCLLDDHRWLEAYEAIRTVCSAERRQDCVHRFLSVLCEHEEVAADVLCSLPLVDTFNLVEEWLLLSARQSASTAAWSSKFQFLHHLLFIVYMNHGDYRGAAGSMYRLAERLPARSVQRKRCLLLAVSCLELVLPAFQWIAMTKEVEEQDERQLFMLSLSDVRSELEGCSTIQDLDALASRGLYRDAFTLAGHDVGALVKLCRHFVERDDCSLVEHLERLPADVQCKLFQLPHCDWLVGYLKETWVNVYLRHFGHDATNVLHEHIERWREHRKRPAVPRPRDLISSTVIPAALKDKHREYLNEIQ